MSIKGHDRQTARLWGLAALTVIALSTEAGPVLADDSINTGYFGGVAIMGYDPVAYFTDNRAVKGSEEFSYDWLGTPWHFASRKHMEMFESEPVEYAHHRTMAHLLGARKALILKEDRVSSWTWHPVRSGARPLARCRQRV
jgi:YHS domain-containing protein